MWIPRFDDFEAWHAVSAHDSARIGTTSLLKELPSALPPSLLPLGAGSGSSEQPQTKPTNRTEERSQRTARSYTAICADVPHLTPPSCLAASGSRSIRTIDAFFRLRRSGTRVAPSPSHARSLLPLPPCPWPRCRRRVWFLERNIERDV